MTIDQFENLPNKEKIEFVLTSIDKINISNQSNLSEEDKLKESNNILQNDDESKNIISILKGLKSSDKFIKVLKLIQTMNKEYESPDKIENHIDEMVLELNK